MKILVLTALAALSLGAAAPNPVTWKVQGAPTKPVKAGARFSVKVVAQIEEGWHLYSMKPVEDGPIPTRVWLAEGQPFELTGAVAAPPPETVHDPNFNMEVEFYEGQAAFTLPVRISAKAGAGPQKMQVSASYQSCNNKICLPPKTVKIEAPVEIGK